MVVVNISSRLILQIIGTVLIFAMRSDSIKMETSSNSKNNNIPDESQILLSSNEVTNSIFASFAAYEGNDLSSINGHSLELIDFRIYGTNSCTILLSEDCLYIALKGTTSLNDWRQNLSVGQVSLEGQGSVHGGFYEKALQFPLKEIVSEFSSILSPSKIIVCGHSQGGAVAQLTLSLLLLESEDSRKQYSSIRAVGIGSPYFGDISFRETIKSNGMYRNLITIAAGTDIVPSILNLKESVPKIFDKVEALERTAEAFLQASGFISPDNAYYKAAVQGRRFLRSSMVAATQIGLAPSYVPIGLYRLFKDKKAGTVIMTGWIENSDQVNRLLDQNLVSLSYNSISDHFARKYIELIAGTSIMHA